MKFYTIIFGYNDKKELRVYYITYFLKGTLIIIINTISVPQNLLHFDPTRILKNVIESELKKLVGRESYF